MIKEIVANIKTDDLEIYFEWIVATLMRKSLKGYNLLDVGINKLQIKEEVII